MPLDSTTAVVLWNKKIAHQIQGKPVSSCSGAWNKWGAATLHSCLQTKGDSAQCFSGWGDAGGRDLLEKLTAEPKWAKCSKRWSSSGQVPPLVPTAKVKLNLLSAPFKRVSQGLGSSLALPSITPAGTKAGGTLPPPFPQRNGDQSSLHSHWNHQGPTVPQWLCPFHCIVAVTQTKCKKKKKKSASDRQLLSSSNQWRN